MSKTLQDKCGTDARCFCDGQNVFTLRLDNDPSCIIE
jgi:hypothetical protein